MFACVLSFTMVIFNRVEKLPKQKPWLKLEMYILHKFSRTFKLGTFGTLPFKNLKILSGFL